jgi:hypothetical protein
MYATKYVYKAMHMQYNKMCQPSSLYIHLTLLILLHYFLIPNIKYEIHRRIPSKDILDFNVFSQTPSH